MCSRLLWAVQPPFELGMVMVWHFSNKMVRLVGNNTTLRRIITLAKKEIMKKIWLEKEIWVMPRLILCASENWHGLEFFLSFRPESINAVLFICCKRKKEKSYALFVQCSVIYEIYTHFKIRYFEGSRLRIGLCFTDSKYKKKPGSSRIRTLRSLQGCIWAMIGVLLMANTTAWEHG